MSKDVVVVVSLQQVDTSVDALDILLVSTAGAKDAKSYRTLEGLKADWAEDTSIYKRAAAIFGQGKARPAPEKLIQKVKVVGLETPESPEALVNAIKEYQKKDNDWYLFMTDQEGDSYIVALSKFAEDSEPSEAELAAGKEDHRKFYFAQTNNKELKAKARRSAVIYTETPGEQAAAAWIGTVGPWYPQSVTWKFKMPMGISVPALTEEEIGALEENHINFVTNEYKRNYIKNGCCLDGEWIDAILGGDWIAKTMREKLYDIFLNNPNIPYTDAGFTLIAAGVFETLEDATGYSILARSPESGAGIYNVMVPKRSEVTEEQAASRQMPDIGWEAQLGGAVHGAKIKGTLKVTL
ncbi:MAG: DUF3383 domain-containing protein [Lachnospiraceae bacterium]|jgi:hypothetical protein|nr:DUF3383 domain-containing protein [Lachnospiraceae bacterium]